MIITKVFKNSDEGNMATIDQRNAANAEIEALEKLSNHRNILNLEAVEYIEETGRICLITPWAAAGSLERLIGVSDEQGARNLFHSLIDSGYDIEAEEEEYVKSLLDDLEEGQKDIWLDDAFLLIGILEGIHHAHNQGIYHRDLKPANVLIDLHSNDDDTDNVEIIPLICDFGASKIRGHIGEITDYKKTLVYVRTPAYRWSYPDSSAEDQKEKQHQDTWDLVSWGIIAIECLADKNVETPDEAVELLNENLSDLLDQELVDLLAQAISKDPEKRPTNLGKFKEKIIEYTESRKEKLNWEED